MLLFWKLAPYLAIGAVVAAAWGIFEWRGREIDRLEAEVGRLSQNLASCGARFNALIRDKERDDAIDNLSDEDLRRVPPHWIRGE